MSRTLIPGVLLLALAAGGCSSQEGPTLKGRLLLLVGKFFPWIIDRVSRRKVRDLYREEIDRLKALRLSHLRVDLEHGRRRNSPGAAAGPP